VKAPDPYLGELAERGYRDGDAPRFRAVWERLEAAYLRRVSAAAAPHGEWRDRVRAAAAETARLVERHPEEARFLTVDAHLAGALGRECQSALSSSLAELVDSARAELEDPDTVSEATASWVVGVFFDRVYRRCATGAGPDLPSQLPELMFLAVSAYFGTEAGLEELASES
jgi:hypothetical protein